MQSELVACVSEKGKSLEDLDRDPVQGGLYLSRDITRFVSDFFSL